MRTETAEENKKQYIIFAADIEFKSGRQMMCIKSYAHEKPLKIKGFSCFFVCFLKIVTAMI